MEDNKKNMSDGSRNTTNIYYAIATKITIGKYYRYIHIKPLIIQYI